MADTSITKIIIRHGTDGERDNMSSGDNQLDLGEPGYSTDTQELYIGNGKGKAPKKIGPFDPSTTSIWTKNENDSIYYTVSNVGIGTATPITNSKLDVAGAIAITSESSTPAAPADGQGYIYSKSDGKLYWRSYDLTETELTQSGGGSSLWTDNADGSISYTQKDSNNSVGVQIGPGKLQLLAMDSQYEGGEITLDGAGSSPIGVGLDNYNNRFRILTNNTERVSVKSTGEVGIGAQTAPLSLLHVGESSKQVLGSGEDNTLANLILEQGTGNDDRLIFDTKRFPATATAGAGSWYTAKQRIRRLIDGSGKVGFIEFGHGNWGEKHNAIDNGVVAFGEGEVTLVKIDSTGRLNIGTPDAPAVSPTGTNAANARFYIGGTAGTDGMMFPDGTLQTTACAATQVFRGADTWNFLSSDGKPGIPLIPDSSTGFGVLKTLNLDSAAIGSEQYSKQAAGGNWTTSSGTYYWIMQVCGGDSGIPFTAADLLIYMATWEASMYSYVGLGGNYGWNSQFAILVSGGDEKYTASQTIVPMVLVPKLQAAATNRNGGGNHAVFGVTGGWTNRPTKAAKTVNDFYPEGHLIFGTTSHTGGYGGSFACPVVMAWR